MRELGESETIVVKVGTSTLTYENGNLNLKRIEELVKVLSDLGNSGKKLTLVTSGAIGVGLSKMKIKSHSLEVREKQALSAIGQCQLMSIYDEFFKKYNKVVGQVLLTKDVVNNQEMMDNAKNTFKTMFEYDVIPIINENDTISINEIVFGDNDTLSAYVANIIKADLLIILTDIDGLYDKNPKEKEAKLIPYLNEITDDIRRNAEGTGSDLGTGGMITKLMAAEIANRTNTKTLIIKGERPEIIYQVLEGKDIGTYISL